MEKQHSFKEEQPNFDLWANEKIAHLNEDYEEFLGMSGDQRSQVILKNLATLKNLAEQSIMQLRAQDMPDEEKKKSIRDILDSYKNKQASLLKQLN